MLLTAALSRINQPVSIERRARIRFALALAVQYRTLGRGHTLAGTGRVVNISSEGLLVASQHEIRTDAQVDLRIDWPFLLDGRMALQLVTVGRVVRCGTSSFAVVLARHHFRIRSKTVVAINACSLDPAQLTAMKVASA